MIELKRRRRISVGPYITFVFENRDTIRFQIQEMARVEKLYSDEQIENELRIYNPLIPEPGHAVGHDVHRAHQRGRAAGVAAEARRRRARVVRCASATVTAPSPSRCALDAEHEAQLTREDTTSAVHYVHARALARHRSTGSPASRWHS